MNYSKLGELNVSCLGIGGLHFGNLCDQETATGIIDHALGAGVNFIDTAPLYGNSNSETFIGRAVKNHRHDVLLATKVGLEADYAEDGTFGVSVLPLTRENIRTSIEKSLKNLGTDYIDLYQVHAFDSKTPLEETMEALDELIREGKVRYIGCSNYLAGELERSIQVAEKKETAIFVSFQAHYNMIERRAEAEVIPECHRYGVGIMCNRPLSRGILTGKYQPGAELPEDSRAVDSIRIRRWLSDETLQLVAALNAYAADYQRSVAELAIGWLLAQTDVSMVLTGVRNRDQLDMNIRAADWELSNEHLFEIDRIIDKIGVTSRVYEMPETLFEK